jgi:hypothetical protein
MSRPGAPVLVGGEAAARRFTAPLQAAGFTVKAASSASFSIRFPRGEECEEAAFLMLDAAEIGIVGEATPALTARVQAFVRANANACVLLLLEGLQGGGGRLSAATSAEAAAAGSAEGCAESDGGAGGEIKRAGAGSAGAALEAVLYSGPLRALCIPVAGDATAVLAAALLVRGSFSKTRRAAAFGQCSAQAAAAAHPRREVVVQLLAAAPGAGIAGASMAPGGAAAWTAVLPSSGPPAPSSAAAAAAVSRAELLLDSCGGVADLVAALVAPPHPPVRIHSEERAFAPSAAAAGDAASAGAPVASAAASRGEAWGAGMLRQAEHALGATRGRDVNPEAAIAPHPVATLPCSVAERAAMRHLFGVARLERALQAAAAAAMDE